jgi:creatinine amidohydrolase/Fe(II)-dependent formamide hydrolase-like protein
MKMTRVLALALLIKVLLPAPSCLAQAGAAISAASPDPNMTRPIDALDSVFIEELTWLEVRDALRAGKTTAIVATGGVEQNGPYLATGKHNYVLRATTEAIARKLGNALVAPIVPFVPEGEIDPPAGHMRYPGTISVRQETFKRLLADIASSLRAHGFEHIILLGDSGGNQAGMKEVAAELAAKWAGGRTTIHFVPEYYDYPGLQRWLETQGIRQTDEGLHDDYGITAIMMTVDPNTVRMRQRLQKGRFSINGVKLAPARKTIAMGRRAVDYRAAITAAAIRKVLGERP